MPIQRCRALIAAVAFLLCWGRADIPACLAAQPPTSQEQAAPSTQPAPAAELRVMSFNIRYDNPADGPNRWPLRKELLFRTIEAFDPDLIGLQEVLHAQGEEIAARLKGHEFIGVGRDDGQQRGEMVPVLFRRDRFEKMRAGHFWLSENTDVPGSRGWDAALPRLVTWAMLRDKRHGGRPLLLMNTHFDHRGETARVESAKLIRRRMTELSTGADARALGDVAVLLVGDFNTPPDSPPRNGLVHPRNEPRLTDTFAELNPMPTTRDFTYHAFTGRSISPHRIDQILRSAHFETRRAEIDRTEDNGRFPSDHFPVTAVLEWRPHPTQ